METSSQNPNSRRTSVPSPPQPDARSPRLGKRGFTGAALAVLCTLALASAAVVPHLRQWMADRALIRAVEQRNTDGVLSAVRNGANVNEVVPGPLRKPTPAVYYHNALRGPLHVARPPMATPLMLAVIAGNDRDVQLLLQHGAQVSATDEYGFNALFMAISERRPDITEMLLQAGCDPNSRNEMGMPPLSWALMMSDDKSAKDLIERGADVNRLDPDGRPPIYLATLEHSVPMARLLLDSGVAPDAPFHGFTSLHLAIMQHDAQIARLLLLAGAQPVDNAVLYTLVDHHAVGKRHL